VTYVRLIYHQDVYEICLANLEVEVVWSRQLLSVAASSALDWALQADPCQASRFVRGDAWLQWVEILLAVGALTGDYSQVCLTTGCSPLVWFDV
jgi:hypothetical protein